MRARTSTESMPRMPPPSSARSLRGPALSFFSSSPDIVSPYRWRARLARGSELRGVDYRVAEVAAEALDARGEVGRASGAVARRPLVPYEHGVQVLRVTRLCARRLKHPEVVAGE